MNFRLFKAAIFAICATALCFAGVSGRAQQGQQTVGPNGKPIFAWPNEFSKANSDDWLHIHHKEIYQLRPKVLILNFANGMSQVKADAKITELFLALRESSRYHGFAEEEASPELEYQLFKYVDLQDADPLPPDQVLDGNSSLYPRVPNWKEGINFQYKQLFSDQFAKLYGVQDPKNPARYLTLKELVDQGLIHEVWFFARQGKYGAPFECTEVKQAYDAAGNKIPGKSVQAGNGGTDEQPFIGRSLRILFVNAERGPGCALESLGHAIEGTSNSGAIPYFTKYFTEFAGFDLKTRFNMPFDKFYDREGTDLDYAAPDQIRYKYKGKAGKYLSYYTVGGSVHFAPNARKDYDLENTQPVLSTIEHYRLHDGENEKDQKEPWTIGKIQKYRQLAPDCQGPWMVYWRQCFPAYASLHCTDDTRKQMKSWLPFLYY
jgi:hypothetical protein